MTISVSSPMRSTKCVFLKLNILQKHEMPMVATVSTTMTIHQTL